MEYEELRNLKNNLEIKEYLNKMNMKKLIVNGGENLWS